jgi:hypothetical protein
MGALLNKISVVLAVAGILLMLCSVIGRFVGAQTVFGGVLGGGISAMSAMIGASTLLLLAVLAKLFSK